MQIKLSPTELMLAAMVGVMRNVQNLKAQRPDRYGADPGNAWTPHIEGASGEMAVAKALGIYWNGSVGNLKAPDVGDLQVRTNTSIKYNDLIMHPSDDDDRTYILVSGRGGDFILTGWIKGREGKRQEYWRDPVGGRPAFFVPVAALQPFETLERTR